jgi:hypothetical protein
MIPSQFLPPFEADDYPRVEHSRLRRRMMYGQWEEDLRAYTRAEIGSERADVHKVVDLSANTLRSACQSVAVLYDRPPIVGHEDGEAATRMSAVLDEAGWAPLMARVQRDCLAMREIFVRVDPIGPDAVVLRPVWSDMVSARPDSLRRDLPIELAESVLYDLGDRVSWCYDVSDARTGTRVVYSWESGGRREVTAEAGVSPLWQDSSGAWVLPYATYHAARTGYLWDWSEGAEAVSGTLAIGVLWSMWRHLVRSASWPQRYAAGLTVAAAETEDGRTEVVTDPATVLLLRASSEEGGQAMIGQWQAGGDPEALARAIGLYERRVSAALGLSPADATRTSGDPRSGYALEVSRESQRDAARRLEPQFRRGDLSLIRIVATALNAAGASPPFPESGWTISYQSLPPSQSEVDSITARRDAGLMSREEAYIELHPGMSVAQARAALALIDAETPPNQGESDE